MITSKVGEWNYTTLGGKEKAVWLGVSCGSFSISFGNQQEPCVWGFDKADFVAIRKAIRALKHRELTRDNVPQGMLVYLGMSPPVGMQPCVVQVAVWTAACVGWLTVSNPKLCNYNELTHGNGMLLSESVLLEICEAALNH